MDVFNPPERQHIIPPPPPANSGRPSSANNSTFSPPAEQNNIGAGGSSSSSSNGNTGAASNNSFTVTIDTKQMQSELERRQQELDRKAAELAAREEALRQGGEFRRQHNWPPLPSFCPLKPCFFQDINVDIRPEFQKTVELGYHIWIAFVFAQLLNILAGILLISYGVPDAGQNLSFGIMTFVFFVPLSYLSWFRPLYKAFRNDSSFNFVLFFFVFFMQTLIVGLWSLGLPTGGPCGLYVAIKNMGTSVFLSMVLFLVTASWMVYTAASALYFLKVHSIYRSSGASWAKATNEFAQGIISNQYVQQTVANAARQTATQTFAAASSGAGAGTGASTATGAQQIS